MKNSVRADQLSFSHFNLLGWNMSVFFLYFFVFPKRLPPLFLLRFGLCISVLQTGGYCLACAGACGRGVNVRWTDRDAQQWMPKERKRTPKGASRRPRRHKENQHIQGWQLLIVEVWPLLLLVEASSRQSNTFQGNHGPAKEFWSAFSCRDASLKFCAILKFIYSYYLGRLLKNLTLDVVFIFSLQSLICLPCFAYLLHLINMLNIQCAHNSGNFTSGVKQPEFFWVISCF